MREGHLIIQLCDNTSRDFISDKIFKAKTQIMLRIEKNNSTRLYNWLAVVLFKQISLQLSTYKILN